MRVGDYDRNVSSRSIKEILAPYDDGRTAEEDDADGEGDDGGIAAFIATDAEVILNELSKISDGDQSSSLHKRLKPLAAYTREPATRNISSGIFCSVDATSPTSVTATSCGINR